MKTIRFGSTRLLQSNKKGILKPDADGYVEMVLGGLNAFNSAGEYYTLAGAEDLFKSSSILMRRIQNGVLKSELGHPKRAPGMSDDEFLTRVLSIEETNVSTHIKEIYLDHEFGRKFPQFKNPGLVAIIGRVRPSGPHGPALEASIANPSENVTYSIRALSDNYYERGQCYRVLSTIVTFDQVTEQGINIANKWNAPTLESYNELPVTARQLKSVASASSRVATESVRSLAHEALENSTKRLVELPRIPLYGRW